mmetsp:Transcript_25456/g.58664  ORF Transcript_25456/g.58664 Transcript_25456/m.58664 type:complete len:229 (+) Transcript_25456:148-834(+)
MGLVVVLLGVFNTQAVLHAHVVLHAHEVVVPDACIWHHEEAQEDVTEQHLHFLCMCWQETRRVGTSVLVRLTPLEALWGDPIGRQGDTSGCEAAGDDDCLICQPGLVVGKHLGMEGDILGAQVRLFMWLRVDPTKWFKITQVIMIRELLRQRDTVVRADLGHHHHAPDFLHLRVIRWGDTIQVCSDFCPQIADTNEALQNVLWHDVRVASLPDVFTIHVEVIRSQVQR